METDTQYTIAQLKTLSEKQIAALALVADRLLSEADPLAAIIAMDDEELTSTFNLFRPCYGCVPPEEIDEDLLGVIHKKFSIPINAAIELTGLSCFWPVIDPDYEECTRCVVVDFDFSEPYTYFNEGTKSWHYKFATLADLADEVLRIHNAILAGYARAQILKELEKFSESQK